MHAEQELNPEFFVRQLKVMADVDIEEEMDEKFNLFVGLVAMIKMLQPEGYQQAIPSVNFKP
jgi:hypothetical protein